MSRQSFIVKVPASTANLGPGFDCLGLALGLWLEIKVECKVGRDKKLTIDYRGDSEALVPRDDSNLIIQSALHLISRISGGLPLSEDLLPVPLHVSVTNEIPLSRGLGSSASAIVGGLLLANELCDFKLSASKLLEYAVELEPHPDNVGASLAGGFIAGFVSLADLGSQMTRRRCSYVKMPWNRQIKAVVCIPDFHLSTKACREVLPDSYSRADTVLNLQRLALLIATLSNSTRVPDGSLLQELLADSIHQPYRMKLIPGLDEMIKVITPATQPGLLGIVLSGAGPTVLAFAVSNFEEIGERMQAIFKKQQPSGISSRVEILDVVETGAQVFHQ